MAAPPKKPYYVSARLYRLEDSRALRTQQDHANRLDATSQQRRRKDGDPAKTLAFDPWRRERPPYPFAPFDYVGDFDRMLVERQIGLRGNAASVAHFIFQVSKEWITETGDLHDPANPRNRETFNCAIAWAHDTFGKDCVLSARMDMDETGGGTVDVFVCAEAKTKTGKRYLSISPALRQLQKKHGSRNTFAALQDSVAEYTQANLDSALKRGNRKEGKGPDRITPENYAERAVNERRRNRLERVRVGQKARKKQIREAEAELDRERAVRIAHEAALAEQEANISAAEDAVKRRTQALEDKDKRLAKIQFQLENRQDEIMKKEKSLEQREWVFAEKAASLKTTESEIRSRLDNVALTEKESSGRAEAIYAAAKTQGLKEGRILADQENNKIFEKARADGWENGFSESRKQSADKDEALNHVLWATARGAIGAIDRKTGKVDFLVSVTPSDADSINRSVMADLPRTADMAQKLLRHRASCIDYGRKNGFEAGMQAAANENAAVREKAKEAGRAEGLAEAKKKADSIIKAFEQGIAAFLDGVIRFQRQKDRPEKPPSLILAKPIDEAGETELRLAMSFGLTKLLERIQGVLVTLGAEADAVRKKLADRNRGM